MRLVCSHLRFFCLLCNGNNKWLQRVLDKILDILLFAFCCYSTLAIEEETISQKVPRAFRVTEQLKMVVRYPRGMLGGRQWWYVGLDCGSKIRRLKKKHYCCTVQFFLMTIIEPRGYGGWAADQYQWLKNSFTSNLRCWDFCFGALAVNHKQISSLDLIAIS